MKIFNLVTLILTIIGGLNIGLMGLAGVDVLSAIFGMGSVLTRVIFVIVGLSALWQLVPFYQAMGSDEQHAESHT